MTQSDLITAQCRSGLISSCAQFRTDVNLAQWVEVHDSLLVYTHYTMHARLARVLSLRVTDCDSTLLVDYKTI